MSFFLFCLSKMKKYDILKIESRGTKMNKKLLIYGLLLIQIIVFFISSIYLNIEQSMIISFLLLIIFNIASCCIMGSKWQKKKSLKESCHIILLTMFLYYLVYYFIGIVVGFTLIPEQNINLTMLLCGNVFLVEILRNYLLIDHQQKNNIIVTSLITILLILYYISYFSISFYSLSMFLLVAVTISSNILLSYMSNKIGRIPSILYQGLSLIPILCIPIRPSISLIIMAIALFLLPIILFGQVNDIVQDRKKVLRKVRRVKNRDLIFIPFIVMLLLILGLASGIFEFQIYAIASNSMKPAFSRGDTIIYEHIDASEIQEIQVGDILVYRGDDRILVHRIVKKEYEQGVYLFQTKGDANAEVDKEFVKESQILGVVRADIPYIGYPTVWIRELG